MSLTLLLDLDDTLLENDIDQFLPFYLKALSTELASLVEPQRLIQTLMTATRQMSINERPDCTLKEVFDANFFSNLGLDREAAQPEIDRFYSQVFPSLRALTKPRPAARQLIETAFARGCRVVIATNPLFPRTAITQRLDWGGLSPEKYPFDLITTYEICHFSKPNPAYYSEILARLGWPEGPVVMVGNDLQRDIAAARQAGLAAYWLNSDASQPPNAAQDYAPNGQGSLEDFFPWVDRQSPADLQPATSAPAALLAGLRSTPAIFNSLAASRPPEAWAKRPQPAEWSFTEILCHLRDVEAEVNLPRFRQIIAEDNPFLSGRDTDPWAEERQYILQDGPQALRSFTGARLLTLALLADLPPAGWQRPARHAIFSRTNLVELVGITFSHDRLHVKQALSIGD